MSQTDRRTDLPQAPLGRTDKGRWHGHGALYRLTLTFVTGPLLPSARLCGIGSLTALPLSGWQRLVRGKPCSISRFEIRLPVTAKSTSRRPYSEIPAARTNRGPIACTILALRTSSIPTLYEL